MAPDYPMLLLLRPVSNFIKRVAQGLQLWKVWIYRTGLAIQFLSTFERRIWARLYRTFLPASECLLYPKAVIRPRSAQCPLRAAYSTDQCNTVASLSAGV